MSLTIEDCFSINLRNISDRILIVTINMILNMTDFYSKFSDFVLLVNWPIPGFYTLLLSFAIHEYIL